MMSFDDANCIKPTKRLSKLPNKFTTPDTLENLTCVMSEPTLRNRTSSVSSSYVADNLPPPHKGKAIKPVSAPLSSTRLNRLIYLLVLISTLLGAYYSYRVVQWKSEVGGWWNLAVGKRPPQLETQNGGMGDMGGRKSRGRGKGNGGEGGSVEDRINGLAQALGMPPTDLASAIAIAVREYVPPASLSSVAAKETGPAVEAMLKGASDEQMQKLETEKTQAAAASAHPAGVVGGVVSGMESFVGMDEP
jgi:hypothetical protein